MKIVVTGGIGSGKSTVAKMLARKLGFHFSSVDELVWFLYLNDEVHAKLMSAFDTASREGLSTRAFKDPVMRAQLEEIFYPYIWKSITEEIASHDNLVLEVPLLFEHGQHLIPLFDEVITVTCPTDVRCQRIMKRDDVGLEHITKKMEAQTTDWERFRLSTIIINNDHDEAYLEDGGRCCC